MALLRGKVSSRARLALATAIVATLAAPAMRADPHEREHGNRGGHYGRFEHGRERGYHYRARPGIAVPALPRGYYTLHAPHREYYIHGGHFYQRAHPGFVVVRPPIGVVVTTLPFGYLSLSIGGSRYFFSGGVYFRAAPSGYVVVEPPYPDSAPSGTVVVQANALNVRLGPGLGYAVVSVVGGGMQLPVYGSAANWYYVRTPNGNFGWVMMNFTAPVEVPQG